MPVRLKIVEGPKQGQIFEFDPHDRFVFGRDGAANCQIEGDPAVSRFHFLLEVNSEAMRLKDLGSTNGTIVNGYLIGGYSSEAPGELTCDIYDGALVRVGRTTFEVSIVPDDEPADPLPEMDMAQTEMGTSDDLPGTAEERFPGFRILEFLGEGGMSHVYLALHLATGKQVALKEMIPQVQVSEFNRALFLREMETTQNLRHPKIIECIESGSAGNAFFMAMEYAAGGDLKQYAKANSGKLNHEDALRMMRDALEGMAFAHANGFVHRDLKPPNILLVWEGDRWVAKIADLGFAKNFENAGMSGFTMTGTFAGTPAYMPREQLMDYKRVGPPSDVFSLGATFYNLLTGECPYNLRANADPLKEILAGNIVPITERDPDTPPGIARMIEKALALDPSERYADAGEMLEALDNFIKTGNPEHGDQTALEGYLRWISSCCGRMFHGG
jgi:serine/threonine protein kinase